MVRPPIGAQESKIASGILAGMLIDVDALVLSNDRLSPDYNVVKLAAPEVAARCRPGQFVMAKHGSGPDPLLRRPFSIFEILRGEAGEPAGFSLLNKAVGVVTRMLFALEPGQHLHCLGPLGKPFSVVTPPNRALMVAGGVGLAPFLTLAEVHRAVETPTTLFYGGRTANDLYYIDRFEALGITVVTTTQDGSRGETGLVTAPLERELQATPLGVRVMVYACGPTAMMQAVAVLAGQHGRRSEVSLEQVMGCGLGGCYSCVVPILEEDGPPDYVRSCLDGPVFEGSQIVWSVLV